MTWNVRGAGRPDLARLAEVIDGQHPDVVAVQEIRRSQARSLATLLGWQHHWTRKHYPYSSLAWWLAEGLAIMSPHVLTDPARRSLTPGVSTWTYRHRVVLAATARRDGEALRVYDAHLAAHRNPDDRIAQAERIATMIDDELPPVAVVAGDFERARRDRGGPPVPSSGSSRSWRRADAPVDVAAQPPRLRARARVGSSDGSALPRWRRRLARAQRPRPRHRRLHAVTSTGSSRLPT